MKFPYNPFNDAGITNYEQFKLYPFLVFGTLETIKNRINQQIVQVKDGHFFSERMIVIGERGIGKTSTLFFIKDMLEEHDIRVELFSRLIEDAEHFQIITGDFLAKTSTKPLYILIDFPDTVEIKTFKKFLSFLWSLLTHKNYNKINLIFSMNRSHFEKSFSLSEIFGKFLTMRLERLGRDEAEQLIASRLKKIDVELSAIFNQEVLETVYSYSKGIPRNIVSACSLLVDNLNGYKEMTKTIAESILKERYIEQVINDRTEDLELKRIYRQMVDILQTHFNGTAKSQEDYVGKVMQLAGIGRNSALARIQDLTKFGIFVQYRGGYNRVNKIISLN
jgi:hypothetical protein